MNDSSSRREFLRCTCTSATLLALGWGLTGCDSNAMEDDDGDPGAEDGITISGNTIMLDLQGSQAKTLASAGGFLLIEEAKTLAINTGDEIRAFTSVCTHQQCDINSFQNERLVCPCHGSQYNTDGEVVGGPAPAPLQEFTVERDGNTVTITKA